MPEPADAPTELDAAHAPTEQTTSDIEWRRAVVPAAATFCAGLVVASAVMPWYARQIGPVDSPPSLSGLDAGSFAVIAIALGAFTVVACAVLALEAAGAIAIEPPLALLLTWACLGAALAATALVAYKLVFLPEPGQFFTRDIGLWLAFFGSAGASGLVAMLIPERLAATRTAGSA